jgi:hypothetical protein
MSYIIVNEKSKFLLEVIDDEIKNFVLFDDESGEEFLYSGSVDFDAIDDLSDFNVDRHDDEEEREKYSKYFENSNVEFVVQINDDAMYQFVYAEHEKLVEEAKGERMIDAYLAY